MPYKPGDPRRLASLKRYRECAKGRATDSAWRDANRERIRVRMAAYNQSPKGREIQKQERERIKADPELLERKRAYGRKYSHSAKGKASQVRARRKMGNEPRRPGMPEEARIANKKRIRRKYADSEKGKAKKLEWRESPRGQAHIIARAIRGRLQRAVQDSELLAAQWKALLAIHDYHCVYCCKRGGRLEMDHVVPLSRGGDPDIANVVPSCRTCNRKKSARFLPDACALMGWSFDEVVARITFGKWLLGQQMPAIHATLESSAANG